MKKTVSLVLLAVCALQSGCALVGFPKAKVTYLVMDQNGNPIEGAHVDVGFVEASSRSVSGYTDTNGVFSAQDICSGGCGSEIKKEAFYSSRGGYAWGLDNINKLLGRLEPWNPTVEVRLREIRNPQPMVHKKMRDEIPVFDEPVGYDLEKGDWVKPHGAGEISDFVFTAEKITGTNIIKGVTVKLKFSHELDGLIEFPFDKAQKSYFKWPYEAPDEGYVNTWDRYSKQFYKEVDYLYDNYSKTGKKTLKKYEDNCRDDSDINYIFRVRSQTEESGKLIKACYGRIDGEIRVSVNGLVTFMYWFNPGYSRSLEDDPERNVDLGVD